MASSDDDSETVLACNLARSLILTAKLKCAETEFIETMIAVVACVLGNTIHQSFNTVGESKKFCQRESIT